MSKKGSFWDNPFGGLFDFNGDGKEDLGEQWIGFKIFEDITKNDDDSSSYGGSSYDFDDDSSVDTSWRTFCDDGSEFGIFPEDYLTEDEYLAALKRAKYAWRENCEDGFDVDVDPGDFETEDEYEEALEEARNEEWRSRCEYGLNEGIDPDDYDSEEEFRFALEELRESREQTPLSFKISVECPALDKLEAIKESDYPNKRRYNAAYTLANEFLCYSDEECEKREKRACQFIIDNADKIVAANYLSHEYGFLYAQAIKDNFTLPISLPDEDETREIELSQILCKIAKRDIPLSFEIWSWCMEQFMPYAEFEVFGVTELTSYVLDRLYEFPKKYREKLVHYIEENPDFRQKLMDKNAELSDDLPELVVAAIKEELFSTAEFLFKNGITQAKDDWKSINRLVSNTISWCENGDELESMEYFKEHLFLLVKAINIGMVHDEIDEWEQQINEYIDNTESECDKYAYSRKFSWRNNVPDGKKYGINPLYYDNKQEYLDALHEEKYGWRNWYKNRETYGLNADDFETDEEFSQALNERRNEKYRKEQEERQRQREIDIQKRQNEIQSHKEEMREDKNIYILCGVDFPFAVHPYHYRTEDTTIKIGDKVVVPTGDKETEGTVVSVGQYTRVAAPFPIEKTKFIIRKIESTDNKDTQ